MGPTWNNPVLDPLAVLLLDNQLCTYHRWLLRPFYILFPDSPRAQYDLIRALQYRFYEREGETKITDAERLEHSLDLIQKFVELMTQYRPVEMNEVEEKEEDEEETEENGTLLPSFIEAELSTNLGFSLSLS